jgi:hypothetical protein
MNTTIKIWKGCQISPYMCWTIPYMPWMNGDVRWTIPYMPWMKGDVRWMNGDVGFHISQKKPPGIPDGFS